MSEQATATRKCALCKEREATVEVRFGEGTGARLMGFCAEHAPVLPDGAGRAEPPAKKKRTKNRLAATDHSATISAILYRLGGCTLDQATRWLMLYTPDHFSSQVGARDAAQRALQTMREQRQVEVISMRRTWEGKKTGRRENFFRLSTARTGAAIVEGAAAADEDPSTAVVNYRRVWKSGGTDHAAQRADLYLLWAEEARLRDDVEVDPERMTSETNRAFPLWGAKASAVDKGGEPIKGLKKNARPHYEQLVPDGEWFADFSVRVGENTIQVPCPYWLELERKTDAPEVARKIEKLCGYWERWFVRAEKARAGQAGTEGGPDRLTPERLMRPLVVVHDYTRAAPARGRRPGGGAWGLRQEVGQRLRSYGGGHFAALDARLVRDYKWEQGALGRFFVFAQWETLRAAEDPFGVHYFPVHPYPVIPGMEYAYDDNGWTVGMKAVATEAGRLKVAAAKRGLL